MQPYLGKLEELYNESDYTKWKKGPLIDKTATF